MMNNKVNDLVVLERSMELDFQSPSKRALFNLYRSIYIIPFFDISTLLILLQSAAVPLLHLLLGIEENWEMMKASEKEKPHILS